MRKRHPERAGQLALFDQELASISDKLSVIAEFYTHLVEHENLEPMDAADALHTEMCEQLVSIYDNNYVDAFHQVVSDLIMTTIRVVNYRSSRSEDEE